MKIRATIAAICATVAVAGSAVAHDAQSLTVVPRFDQAIPNIPRKSLVVVVDSDDKALTTPVR